MFFFSLILAIPLFYISSVILYYLLEWLHLKSADQPIFSSNTIEIIFFVFNILFAHIILRIAVNAYKHDVALSDKSLSRKTECCLRKLFMPFIIGLLLLALGVVGYGKIDSHVNPPITPTTIDFPTITPTEIPTPTDTPTPIPTAIPTVVQQVQQSAYFGNALFCPGVYFQGMTACADNNKTPVACFSLTTPIPNSDVPLIVANFICGIPGNFSSTKPCIWYANTPNLISCL